METERLYLDPARMRCSRLRRTVKAAAELLEWETDLMGKAWGASFRRTFITLTYRKLLDWEPGHVSRFIRLMRQWFRRKGETCRFVWVAELQKRGALHYHVLVFVPRSLLLPKPDVCGWWPHGMSKIETARNPVGYMVKYASKITADGVKRMPKGVRIHGNGGAATFTRQMIRGKCWSKWMKEWSAKAWEEGTPGPDLGSIFASPEEYEELGMAVGEAFVKKCTGGYVNVLTGEVYPTPWEVRIDELGDRYLVPKDGDH